MGDVHSNLPSLAKNPSVYAIQIEHRVNQPTWIRGLAIGAPIIARDRPDEVLQGPLIPKLMALADTNDHDRDG